MAQTQTAPKLSAKQREVLDALLRDRVAIVRETTKGDKTKTSVSVVTPKGKPVEGVKLTRAAIESATKKGYLKLIGAEGSGANEDGETTTESRYEITSEGKEARKVK